MRNTIVILFCAALLLPASAAGDHLSDGLAAYNIGDYDKSMENCLPLAEEGVPAAQFCVGRLYAQGFGVPMDDAQAHKWYGLAAEAGHAEAQFNLGVMHANGWGTPMDDVKAAVWYRKAAEHGNVQAQMALADALHAGRGIEKNIPEAYTWYSVAAELGDMTAVSRRKDVGAELAEAELAAADAKAREWVAKISGEMQAGHSHTD